MDDDQLINNVYRKIEREQKLIDGANSMRQSTDNPTLQHRLDAQIREGRKNIGYLEERMRELQLRRMGQTGDRRSGGPMNDGASHGPRSTQPGVYQHVDREGAPTPPPKNYGPGYGTDAVGYGDPGPGGYSSQLGGGLGMMPPRPPYGPPPPTVTPKARPNYSKLGRSSCIHSLRRGALAHVLQI